jgi:predicted dehydrogenase
VYGNKVYLHGVWAFNVSSGSEMEATEIIGDKGKIRFSFFRTSEIEILNDRGSERISLEYPENIQQPMIEQVVKYFRNEGPNPCSLEDALVTMRMMDRTRQRENENFPIEN